MPKTTRKKEKRSKQTTKTHQQRGERMLRLAAVLWLFVYVCWAAG